MLAVYQRGSTLAIDFLCGQVVDQLVENFLEMD